MLGVCLIWGIDFSMMKFLLRSMSPVGLTALRFLIASSVLWLVARWLERDTRLDARTAWALAGLGVVGNTVYQLGFINGLARTTAANSALLIAATPLATAVLGAIIGAEQLTRPVIMAIGLGTLGVALVILGHGDGISFSTATLSGDLLTLVAVICWSAFTHGVRRIGARGVSPLQVAAITTIGGTPGLVLAGWAQLRNQSWSAVGVLEWGALLYSALLSIVVCYVIWNHSVRRIGANRTALFGVTTPLFAIVAGAVMLGERPSVGQLVGAVFILASVVVNVRAHWLEGADQVCEEGV
jgi:drug/metabolite transporter (DMT)-like permease